MAEPSPTAITGLHQSIHPEPVRELARYKPKPTRAPNKTPKTYFISSSIQTWLSQYDDAVRQMSTGYAFLVIDQFGVGGECHCERSEAIS
ncbi:MAG: hypothetical protein AB1473_10000 [Thermodesulfobacteriota bacterium]